MNAEYKRTGYKIRRIMFADKGFRRYYDEEYGMDLLGWQGTQKTVDVALDPYYFYDKAKPFETTLKVVK